MGPSLGRNAYTRYNHFVPRPGSDYPLGVKRALRSKQIHNKLRICFSFGPVAQGLEQSSYKRQADGSNPSGPTTRGENRIY